MKTYTRIALIAIAAVVVSAGIMSRVNAQVATTMPTLYNQSGVVVNAGTGYLSAGNYYLGGGLSYGGHQVEYYGNGTFYDPTTMQYGGSITNTNGTAGAVLGYAMTTTPSGRTMATMPIFYVQNGSTVNTNGGYLTSGYYYIGGGLSSGGHQVQYYGNGTFYDPSILQYGGSVTVPNGTAGVALGYVK
jgi:hypothetical protein